MLIWIIGGLFTIGAVDFAAFITDTKFPWYLYPMTFILWPYALGGFIVCILTQDS